MSITLVLCVNVGLQFVVVDKIIDMAYEKRYELEYKLFGEPGRVGMCVIREKDELPYVSRLNPEDIPDRLLGCTSTSISILSNVTVLDTNNDGSWTEEEASALGQIWEEKYKKNSVLVQLFRSLQRLAQEERLLAQLAAGSDADATLGDATDSLPMPWMEMEKEKLLLCALVEPKLCSNLEVCAVVTHTIEKATLSQHLPRTGGAYLNLGFQISPLKVVLKLVRGAWYPSGVRQDGLPIRSHRSRSNSGLLHHASGLLRGCIWAALQVLSGLH